MLCDDPVILECGGHNGSDTVHMACKWPNAAIYSFEPIPELFHAYFERTKKFPNIKVFELALSDITGTQTFYRSELKSSEEVSGASSLLPATQELIDLAPAHSFHKILIVNSMTLDDWAAKEQVDHIDFMWLDMQGFELNMLKASDLTKRAKLIYMKVEFIPFYEGQYLYSDIKQWMIENGFVLLAVDFDESFALSLDKIITPGLTTNHFFGNAIFLNTNY